MKKNLIYLLFICLFFAGCEDEETKYDLGTVFDVSDVEVIIADTGEVSRAMCRGRFPAAATGVRWNR